MKTSMLNKFQRKALTARWPEVLTKGVADEGDEPLYPGDLVRLPLAIRWGSGPELDVSGTVTGFAVDKRGVPSVVVHAPAWTVDRVDSWRTWIVNGDFCAKVGEEEVRHLFDQVASRHGEAVGRSTEAIGRSTEAAIRRGQATGGSPLPQEIAPMDARIRETMAKTWLGLMVSGVRTRAGVAIQPGELLRLPRNVARNRGSQLHAAGLCLGYAVGLDGSPCVVVDAVGEDVPELVRWRTWVVRGAECLVIDSKEAWRLEAGYDRDGRLRKGPKKG